MTRRFLPLSAFLMAAAIVSVAAKPAPEGPSVLVQVTSVQTGSLPRIVTAYGSVQPGSSARQTVMAPASAVVGNVYVRQGEEVTKGASLVRLVPSPGAAASYAQAESALRVAKALVERTKRMVRQHLATQQQLADAEKSEFDTRSSLAALRAQGAGGPNTLRAPFHAIVTALSTSPGAIVTEGSALLELTRPEGLILRVGVVPSQATAIKPGAPVKIKPLGSTEVVSGKVLLRGSLVDSRTGLIPVEISLPADRFLSGEMAEADITTGETQGYVVPHQAILVNDQGAPYVVQAVDMVAKKVSVEILGSEGNRDVVGGQLDVKAPLVLSGNYQLEDGMKVRFDNPAEPNGKAAK